MKINDKSIMNVVLSDDFRNHHIKHVTNFQSFSQSESDKMKYGFKINFFNRPTYRTRKLILSSKVKEQLNDLIVPKDIRFDVMKTLPDRDDVIQIDDDTCLRYVKEGDLIMGSFDTWKGNFLHNYFFLFHCGHEYTLIDTEQRDERNIEERHEEFKEKIYSKFMVIVTYLELTDVSLNVIEGNKSFGTKKNNKIKNETNKRVILVTSNWNTQVIRLNDIHVRGHWRLQPYGVGRSSYKYIYIQPFDKGITQRLPKKELVG